MKSLPAGEIFASLTPLIAAALLAVASAGVSIWLSAARFSARWLVSFSAGILLGIAAFGILPELGETFGKPRALAFLLCGFALLWFVNRFVYAVCPSCAHTHDHDSCSVALHGFATPLIVAGGLHSFMDGFAIAAAQREGGLGTAVTLAVMLHKIPEGLAYGAMLRASLRTRWHTLAWCALIQSPTLAGGIMESIIAPRLGESWIGFPLAIAGGSFVFLGSHALHNEWKRRGAVPSFGPALTGAAGAAVLQQGLRLFGR
jgi:zinc transporter ZupT